MKEREFWEPRSLRFQSSFCNLGTSTHCSQILGFQHEVSVVYREKISKIEVQELCPSVFDTNHSELQSNKCNIREKSLGKQRQLQTFLLVGEYIYTENV